MLRKCERQTFYLVGTPRGRISQHEKHWLDLPWQKVRDSVEVKLYTHDNELYVLAKSEGRQQKEIAIRRRRLVRLLRKLRAMRHKLALARPTAPAYRSGQEAGRAFGFVKIQLPSQDESVTRDSFRFHVDQAALKEAARRDGYYLLRPNLTGEDPAVLWSRYVQFTQIESVFRSLKSELGIRPIYHQKQDRADAHIPIAFFGLLSASHLKNRLMAYAPGVSPLAVLEKLGTIQMIDVLTPVR